MAELKEVRALKVALAGNPNSGKTTLFNVLTGLHQRTGNFPGVTVEKKSGFAKITDPLSGKQIPVEFIDLPGAYSLLSGAPDEKIAAKIISDKNSPDHPDLIIVVVDASNLKRNLFFATQVLDQHVPVVIALSMSDLLEKRGEIIDVPQLSKELGVKIVKVNARKNMGLDDLRAELILPIMPPPSFSKEAIEAIDNPTAQTIERYRLITQVVSKCVKKTATTHEPSFTERVDKILLHRIWGYLAFLVILFFMFETIFYIAAFPMAWLENLFIVFSSWASEHLPAGELSALLVNGVLAGLSGVLVFIPQIALLFAFIAILEDTGYMARVSFIMDKLMRKFGLNGRSVIPLISGMACAVPAIMGTRTISNWKERLITILVTPLMSCSARLPVYTLLISLVIPHDKTLGFFNLQGMVLMGLYLVGFIAAMASALLMNFLVKAREKSYFIMEMPVYRSPRVASVLHTIIDKVKVFVWDAGRIIVAISIILWVLSSHGPGDRFASIEKKYAESTLDESVKRKHIASEKLQASYAGILGKKLEPIITPLGFDWKIGIALVTSFAAREVFVGTMATIYSVGDENSHLSIREKMLADVNPNTGQKTFTVAVGISLMLFYAFAMQCMSTFAVVYRETKGLKWPLIQFAYMGALAYLSSFIAYQWLK